MSPVTPKPSKISPANIVNEFVATRTHLKVLKVSKAFIDDDDDDDARYLIVKELYDEERNGGNGNC